MLSMLLNTWEWYGEAKVMKAGRALSREQLCERIAYGKSTILQGLGHIRQMNAHDTFTCFTTANRTQDSSCTNNDLVRRVFGKLN